MAASRLDDQIHLGPLAQVERRDRRLHDAMIHSTDPVFATTSTSAPCGTSRATRPAITFLAGLGADDLLNAAVPAEVDQTLRKLRSRSSSQISFPRCAGEVAWNGNFRTFCIN